MDIGTPERNAEQNAETRWLSYREIASIRGISRASAARMARLHRWARRKNNAGVTVCAVPLAYAEPEQERPAETQPENPTFPAEVVAISALHSAIDVLRNQLIRETARSDRLQAELEHAKVEAAGVRQQVEALRQAEAARAGKGRWARLRAAWRGE